MQLAELKNHLNRHPENKVRFLLPDGNFVPVHAHVTEVARIDKRFVDCGGTLRSDCFCRLQTWFSDDVEHRLTAAKLVKILEKANSFLGSGDLEVDIEHEVGFISQFPLSSVEVSHEELILHLTERHTACLAPDRCLPAPKLPGGFNPVKFNFRGPPPAAGCCAE